MDCLKNIVGLSPTNCDCWDSTKPVDFVAENASSSGLYVSQLDTIALRWTNSASDCENGGMWSMIIAARDSAIRDVLQGFLEEISIKNEERFLPFSKIGDSYYKQADLVNSTMASAWIQPYEIKGGKLKVESVSIAFWSGVVVPTNVQIDVYSSLDFTTPINSATAAVASNKQFFDATFTVPLLIDLSNVRQDLNERFYFVYTIPPTFLPVKNLTEIGSCCNGSQTTIKNPYKQIMTLGGSQAATVSALVNSSGSTMNGLVINATLECDYYSWLCDLAQKPMTSTTINGSGQNLRLGMVLADTIQAKSVVNLLDGLIQNSRINQFTMIQGNEELYQKRNHFEKIFLLGIKNLAWYMPKDKTDCLICRKDNRIIKTSILV